MRIEKLGKYGWLVWITLRYAVAVETEKDVMAYSIFLWNM